MPPREWSRRRRAVSSSFSARPCPRGRPSRAARAPSAALRRSGRAGGSTSSSRHTTASTFSRGCTCRGCSLQHGAPRPTPPSAHAPVASSSFRSSTRVCGRAWSTAPRATPPSSPPSQSSPSPTASSPPSR
eukprot:807286-Prymnesium_polylepis.1